MSEKYNQTCKYLNQAENFLVLYSMITGGVSISALVSLFCVPVGFMSSSIGIKVSTITAGIKKYKSIIKKKRKNHDEIVLLREYYEMKEKIKNTENSLKYII